MTLLEKFETHLPIARDACERDGEIMFGLYAWFEPLKLWELEEIVAALRTVAEQQ